MPRRRPIPTLTAAALCTLGGTAYALPPRYDHVVVVVLENINGNQVIGSASTPYLTSLAAQGASLSNAYAFIHTSAPNYGELFAGADNGIADGVVPPGVPFTTPNIGAEVRQKGFTFAGYAQSMPSVGYTGLASGEYVRGHNPWVNWQNDAPSAHVNQLPSSTNLPFTLFPTSAAGFAALPTVSFVTPDNDNNMHNGATLAERLTRGDNFVKNNLDAYYQWAKTHNSLLIVTADEDDRATNTNNYNKVPAIFAGANVKAGATGTASFTLHNMLRTVEDMYGLQHAAGANYVRPIAGVFAGDPGVNVKTFQNGVAGYAGAHDTHVRADAPTSTFGSATPLMVNLDTSAAAGNQPAQALVRFDNLIGASAAQIPADATVLSAKLQLWVAATTAAPVRLHRMLTTWTETSTWNGFGNGIATDDAEAASAVDFSYGPKVNNEPFFFDVSDSVQKWLDGAPNFGWAIVPTGADDFQFQSAEAGTVAQRPLLEVAYALYPRFTAAGGSWGTAGNWANGTPNGAAAVARFLTRPAAATLTLDGDKTVGSMIFDSPGAYTVNPGSGGTLTLANYGNVASITVKQGQHTLAVPINAVDPTAVDVAAGGQLNATAGMTVAAGRALTKSGAGVFNVGGGLILNAGASAVVGAGELRASAINGSGALIVNAGASAKLTGPSSVASKVTAVTLSGATDAWTSKVDVGVSGLVLEYTGASPLATVANQIKTARAGGWSGNGIGSSAAPGDASGAVGIAEASTLLNLGAGQTAMFLGQQVDSTSLLVRFTKVGDATLDGKVDFADLVKVAQNYDASPGVGGWARGDFDYDGVVGFADLTAVAQNYESAVPASAGFSPDFDADLQAAFAQVSVPEPSVLGVFGVGLGLFRRRIRVVA